MVPRALLFDYGGTLDAPGIPWVERFLDLYRQAQSPESEERVRLAFGHATRCAYASREIAAFGLEQTVAFHVAHQLEFLHCSDPALAARIAEQFVRLARKDLESSREILERLHPRFSLGVISNFYGNVRILLAEAGIAPLLTVIVDSNEVGVSKPDAAIFRMAIDKIGCAPGEAMYVGDSFDKDIVGAHAAGLRTAWLIGTAERKALHPELVDMRLRALADLLGL